MQIKRIMCYVYIITCTIYEILIMRSGAGSVPYAHTADSSTVHSTAGRAVQLCRVHAHLQYSYSVEEKRLNGRSPSLLLEPRNFGDEPRVGLSKVSEQRLILAEGPQQRLLLATLALDQLTKLCNLLLRCTSAASSSGQCRFGGSGVHVWLGVDTLAGAVGVGRARAHPSRGGRSGSPAPQSAMRGSPALTLALRDAVVERGVRR